MKKYLTYSEEEVRANILESYGMLHKIVNNLAMISQQIDGTRKNIDSSYLKDYVMDSLNCIVNNLRSFKVDMGGLPDLSLEESIKNLENKMKEDLY